MLPIIRISQISHRAIYIAIAWLTIAWLAIGIANHQTSAWAILAIAICPLDYFIYTVNLTFHTWLLQPAFTTVILPFKVVYNGLEMTCSS